MCGAIAAAAVAHSCAHPKDLRLLGCAVLPCAVEGGAGADGAVEGCTICGEQLMVLLLRLLEQPSRVLLMRRLRWVLHVASPRAVASRVWGPLPPRRGVVKAAVGSVAVAAEQIEAAVRPLKGAGG